MEIFALLIIVTAITLFLIKKYTIKNEVSPLDKEPVENKQVHVNKQVELVREIANKFFNKKYLEINTLDWILGKN